MSRVDYDERLYRVYRAGRALSEDTGRLWMDAIGRHLEGERRDLTVLDLGAGAGRFATLLSGHPRVRYRDGAATAIPAADAAFDFAFLSMMIHHVPDVAACARELHRVVRPDGLVFVRNG